MPEVISLMSILLNLLLLPTFVNCIHTVSILFIQKDPFGSAHTKHKTSESDDLFITAVENSKDTVEDSVMQITGATVTSSEVTAQSSDDDDLFSVKPKNKPEVKQIIIQSAKFRLYY